MQEGGAEGAREAKERNIDEDLAIARFLAISPAKIHVADRRHPPENEGAEG